DQHHAGPAVAHAAAVLGAGKIRRIAQCPQQGRLRIHVELDRPVVDGERGHGGSGLAQLRQDESILSIRRVQAAKSSLPKSSTSIRSRSRWWTSITSGGTVMASPIDSVFTCTSQARWNM